jgi:hypothetical protein
MRGIRKEGNNVKVSWTLVCVLILTNVPTSQAQQLKWGDPNYMLTSEIASDTRWCQITATKAWASKDAGLKEARCMITLVKINLNNSPVLNKIGA